MGDGEPVRDEDLQKVRMEVLTLHDGPIVLVDYDPTWPALFQREAARIRKLLGAAVLSLEHAGSTSVPGVAAKPIIDIVLVVTDSADEAAYVPTLTAAGSHPHTGTPDQPLPGPAPSTLPPASPTRKTPTAKVLETAS